MTYIPSLHRRSGYHFHVPSPDALEIALQIYLVRFRDRVRSGLITMAEAIDEIDGLVSAARQIVALEFTGSAVERDDSRNGSQL